MTKTLLALSAFAAAGCASPTPPRLGIDPTEDVIAAMTLDEKVRFLVGTCTSRATPPPIAPGVNNRPDYPGSEADSGADVNTFLSGNRVAGAAGEGFAIPRLGIPALVYADGPAGLRIAPKREGDAQSYYCTAFPTATLLASTWNPQLVERVGSAIGEEVHEYGVDVLLAPGMNIQRSPLTGRNFEYYSEDPLLSGKTAAAYVRGVQSQGVGTSVKHFAANNQETYRNGIDTRISERALREIYLRGFEIAVREGRPWTVMSSYNKINGCYASENSHILRDILRDEWDFRGFVMTDWWGADDPVAQMEAGNNLLMPGSPYQIEEIREAVLSGKLDERVLDRNIREMLDIILESPVFKGYPYGNQPDLSAHAAISREVAGEGMVLLENRGALPLPQQGKIALFGNYSYDTQPGGSGSGYVNRRYKISVRQGLADAGYSLNSALVEAYEKHIAQEKALLPEEYFWVVPTASEYPVPTELIAEAARTDDWAVLTLGRMSGEGGDREATAGDYLLSDYEQWLLRAVCQAFHAQGKKVTLLLNIGAPVELSPIQAWPDAILLSWLPGQEAGHAIADVLTGAVNPSGKLPVSLARNYADIPAAQNFGLSPGEENAVRYEEDLQVGYRYFTTAGKQPLYPFGYGKSYTQFVLSDFQVEEDGDTLIFSLDIRNSGPCSGKEVAQIYVSKPQDPEERIPVLAALPERPVRELCAFQKSRLLAPGEVEHIRIPIAKADLRQFVVSPDGSWRLIPGTYCFYAAASSEDISHPFRYIL